MKEYLEFKELIPRLNMKKETIIHEKIKRKKKTQKAKFFFNP